MHPGPARQAAIHLLTRRHPEELDWLTGLFADDQHPSVDTDWPDEFAVRRRINRPRATPAPKPGPTTADLELLEEAIRNGRLTITASGRVLWLCTCGTIVRGGPGRCAGPCPDSAPWVRAAAFAQAVEDDRIVSSPSGRWYEACPSCGIRKVGGHPADCDQPRAPQIEVGERSGDGNGGDAHRPENPSRPPEPDPDPTPPSPRGQPVDTRTEIDGCFDCSAEDATLFRCPDGQERCSSCRRSKFRLRHGQWEPKAAA